MLAVVLKTHPLYRTTGIIGRSGNELCKARLRHRNDISTLYTPSYGPRVVSVHSLNNHCSLASIIPRLPRRCRAPPWTWAWASQRGGQRVCDAHSHEWLPPPVADPPHGTLRSRSRMARTINRPRSHILRCGVPKDTNLAFSPSQVQYGVAVGMTPRPPRPASSSHGTGHSDRSSSRHSCGKPKVERTQLQRLIALGARGSVKRAGLRDCGSSMCKLSPSEPREPGCIYTPTAAANAHGPMTISHPCGSSVPRALVIRLLTGRTVRAVKPTTAVPPMVGLQGYTSRPALGGPRGMCAALRAALLRCPMAPWSLPPYPVAR